MKARLEKLIPEQQELLSKFRAEWWLAVGLNTARTDRARAEAAILAMRAEIGVTEKPIFIWCQSPATSLLALYWLKSPQFKAWVAKAPAQIAMGLSDKDSLRDWLRDSLRDWLQHALRDTPAGQLPLHSSWSPWGERPGDPVGDPLGVWDSLRSSWGNSLLNSLGESLGDSLGASPLVSLG